MVRDIMATFVFRHKMMTYTEFMACEPWEIEMIGEYIDQAEREEWERTRFAAYMTAQVQSTKSLKPTDILKFKWDGDGKQEKTTKEQFEEYKRKMGYN